MSETVETIAPQRPKRDPRKRINYALAGTLLHSGMGLAEIALQVGASNAGSLRAALHRKGVTRKQANAVTKSDTHVQTLTAKVATQAIEVLKERLSERLGAQITTLSASPVGALASKGQGEAAVLKTMAETYKAIYGGAEASVVVFGVNMLEAGPQPQPVGGEPSPIVDIDSNSA